MFRNTMGEGLGSVRSARISIQRCIGPTLLVLQGVGKEVVHHYSVYL